MEGIDGDRVTSWFIATVPGVAPPLVFERLDGGSNLNVRTTDATGRAFVLRRPPTGRLAPGTHDVDRTRRVLEALAPTPVPVPTVLGACADDAVTGAAFFVTEHVPGHLIADAADAGRLLDEAGRRRAGESLVDTLAELHAVDADGAGLGDLGQGAGCLHAQVSRWSEQVDAGQEAAGRAVVLVHDMHQYLVANLPPPVEPALVHGDYRLDNALVGDDGAVRAVLGWGAASVGDPLVDLGQLLVYWTDPGQQNPALGAAPTAVAGFPSRRQMAERYAERSGRDLDRLDLYVAFAYWKLACILEGVYARSRAAGGAGDALQAVGDQVVRLAEAASEAVGALR